MKKISLAIAALLFAVTLSAQPGGMGGFGGGFGGPMGGPGMGPGGPMGPGMGPGMGGDMNFDPFMDARAEIARNRTNELVEILGLDKKQEKKVFQVYNHSDPYVMQELRTRAQKMMAERGDRPERPEGERPQRPEGGRPDFRNGMSAAFAAMGGDGEEMTSIPVSEKERAFREKRMQKILSEAQFQKWMAYEAEKDKLNKIEDL